MSTDIPIEAVLDHIDLALDGMCATVESLGDELVNRRPDLPGANSAYAIVTHCLGVIEYWAGARLAGREIERDREAEFRATGRVAELVQRVRRQRAQLTEDLAGFDGARPYAVTGRRDHWTPEQLRAVRTCGGVLMHLYEELAQHRGHLDLTADLVRADPR
ncbi:DUF664 domain-containing protein [Calidifontibacter sp. DB0510]|uniref:DUF664 domain-containing protein n=1 Tax=Metallococcus carri TaxID=1656884 RepID=A0A967E9Y5_9MICO|nr:DUF664 domain-containing protein [Metallococcus carri]NHN55710.1 DUF664 domain-containing protein [Metallococcus carri]NOP38601.1 DUF664 domain-containing protein [Calidifontibacter sp. DB2511S]